MQLDSACSCRPAFPITDGWKPSGTAGYFITVTVKTKQKLEKMESQHSLNLHFSESRGS
jgi:hypothetical protein